MISNRYKQNLNLISQYTSDNILNNLGLYVKGRIINSIKNGNWTPNSPYTLKMKSKKGGASKAPLINTGTLVRSINFEINKKG